MVIAELYMSQSELDRRCTCGRRATHSQLAYARCASTVFARRSRIRLSLCHSDGISHLHERPRADHINEVCNNKNCRENCFVDGKMTDRICSAAAFSAHFRIFKQFRRDFAGHLPFNPNRDGIRTQRCIESRRNYSRSSNNCDTCNAHGAK